MRFNLGKIGAGLIAAGPMIAIGPMLIALTGSGIGKLMGYRVLGESGIVYYKDKYIPGEHEYKSQFYLLTDDGLYAMDKYGNKAIKYDNHIIRRRGEFFSQFPVWPWFCMITMPVGALTTGLGGIILVIKMMIK